MADLNQHINYTGAYSGLLDNFWVTLSIAAACLIGHEIEVRIPRRRGRDGSAQRIPIRLGLAAQRQWRRLRGRQRGSSSRDGRDILGSETTNEESIQEGNMTKARRKVGSRESWEFGYIFQPKAWRLCVTCHLLMPNTADCALGTQLIRSRESPAGLLPCKG